MNPDASQRVLIARQHRRSTVSSAAVAFAVVGVVTAMVLVFDPPARRVENAGQEGVRVAALFVAALMMYTYLFLVWRRGYWRSWRESPLWTLPASRRRRLRTRIRRNAPPGEDRSPLLLTAEQMRQELVILVFVLASCLLFVASTSIWVSTSMRALTLAVAALGVAECCRLAWNARAGVRYLATHAPAR